MSTQAEIALVAALQAGDADAFATLLRQYGPRLLRLARSLIGNEEDARDVLQDAMVAVHRSIDRFESSSALATWLHRIVVNAALMRLRTKRRHPEEDLDALLPRFAEDGHQAVPTTPWSESAEARLEREETRAAVREAIAKLPETYRVVLLLRDIEELSPQEVAEMLGITTNAVKIRLHRARQALRTLLEREMR